MMIRRLLSPKTLQLTAGRHNTFSTQIKRTSSLLALQPQSYQDSPIELKNYLQAQSTLTQKDVFEYFMLFAADGLKFAQHFVGLALDSGDGVQQDEKAAFTFFKSAADQGHSEAQYFVSEYYLTGCGGVNKSSSEGFKYCKLAADQGITHAKYGVASMLLTGEGCEGKNVSEAFKYMRQAASEGHREAQNFVLMNNSSTSTAMSEGKK